MSERREVTWRRLLSKKGRIHTFYGTSDRVGKKFIKLGIEYNPNEETFPVSDLLTLFDSPKKDKK